MDSHNHIDVTPLVGVALILVIVFVVTSPLIMAPTDMDLDLPKAATVEAKSESNITISIGKDGELAVNEDKVKRSGLAGALKAKLAEDKNRLVVIRADKEIQHKVILELLTVIKKAGAEHIALATIQRNRNGA